MATASATTPGSATELVEAPAYRLRGVKLFASGIYRNKRWTPDEIREMAANARELGPDGKKLFIPSAVPGHEDDDGWREHVDLDERTDGPAAGWVDPATVEAVPDPDPDYRGEMILRGDVVNVPREMAQAIWDDKYKFGSSEIYDAFEDDLGRNHGKVLRRFSYLGKEPPQCKRLGPLPRPEPMSSLRMFSERRGVRVRERTERRGDVIHTYAETTVMDRNQLYAAVQAALPNLSKATLDAMGDDALMDLVNSLPGATAPAPEGAAGAPAPMAEGDAAGASADPASDSTVAGPSRDEMIAELKAAGLSDDDLAQMSDDELAAMLDELDNQDDAAAGDAAGTAAPAATPMAEGDAAADTAAATDTAPDRDAMIAALTSAGQDAAMLDGLSDADLASLYAQVLGGQPATPPADTAASEKRSLAGNVGPSTPMPKWSFKPENLSLDKYGDNKGSAMTRCSEGRPAAAAAPTQTQAVRRQQVWNRIDRMSEQTLRRMVRNEVARKRQVAETFCEKLVRQGRATPAEVKVLHLPLLLSLDDTNPVHKFSENGRTTRLTAFERKTRELAALPTRFTFGERFRGASPEETTDEAEVAKVREFARSLPDNAIKAGGYRSQENFVEKFSEARKKDPALTAEKYLGTGAVA
jgi:hypothetical protein